MIDEKIISDIGLNIKKMIFDEILKLDFIFKGIIVEIKDGNKVSVQMYENVIVDATILNVGSQTHFLKTKINEGDDILIVKTANAGNLALVFSLPLENGSGFTLKAGATLFEEKEQKITLKIKEDSVFEELKSALKEVKSCLDEVVTIFQTLNPWGITLVNNAVKPMPSISLNIAKIQQIGGKIQKNLNKLDDITV